MPSGPDDSEKLDLLLQDAKRLRQTILILDSPEILGTTYGQVMTNLERIAQMGLWIRFKSPAPKGHQYWEN